MPGDVQDTPVSHDDDERQSADSGKTGIALINGPLTALITGVCAIVVAAVYVVGPHLWSSNSPKPVTKPAPASHRPASPSTKPVSASSVPASGVPQPPPVNRVSVSAGPATSAPAISSPASVGSGSCQDVTTASTRIHALPTSNKPGDPTLAQGATIYGTCHYYSLSTSFYMQVTYPWPGGTAKFGYIWMGNLLHAVRHHCYRSDYKGVAGYATYSFDTAACPTASANEAPS